MPFPLVVPALDIHEEGLVRIEVVEGYVANVSFAGDTARLPPAVKAYADRITNRIR